MREPPRLKEGADDVLAASLLDAARAYRRPPSSRARIVRVLGLPVAVSIGAPAMAIASSLATKVVVLVSAATVMVGGGAVAYRMHTQREPRRDGVTRAAPATVAVVRHAPTAFAPPTPEPSKKTSPEEPPTASADATPRIAARVLSFQHPRPQRRPVPTLAKAASRTSEPVTPAAPAAAAVATSVPAPAMKPAPPAPPISAQPLAPVARVSTAAVPVAVAASAPSPRPRPVPAPEPAAQRVALARELELLDAAERAERRGDHAAALVSLDEYARAFPDGAMLAEAKVLRIAALVGNGDEMSAQDLAQAFLARYAPSPLTARVRSMLSKISNAKEKLP